jgi:type 1 glutamine amidotransferase
MTRRFTFLLFSLVGSLAVPYPAGAAEPIRVMLLDGQSGGPYHAWRLTTPVLKKELEETGLFQVDVVTAPENGDFSNFNPQFAKYQAVVLNYDAPDWPQTLRASFEQYVQNGGGVVSVHAADNAFPNWRGFNEMIGVGGWRGRNENAGPHWFFQDGAVKSDSSPGAAGSHGARLPFQLTVRQPEHPIVKGLPKVWMHAGDELYAKLRGPGQNMTVLATAHSDPSNSGTGQDEPILMVLNYGKGRIFHTTMGHDIPALSCVSFIATLQRGTEWAATGKVTQSVPASFPTANTVSYRVDIAAMDPAFKNGPR